MQLKEQKGFGAIFAILIIVAVFSLITVLFFYIQKTQSPTNIAGVNSIPETVSTPSPSPWKTYENQEYRFKITYPRVGVVWDEGNLSEGECGNSIKIEKGNILVDNFYVVKVVFWNETLEGYLQSKGAANAYETETLASSGADEAVRLLRLKPGFEIAVGYPPLVYVKAVFKKGDQIFLMQEIVHNPTNIGGCTQPSVVDPTKYGEIAKQTFDITTSLKFF